MCTRFKRALNISKCRPFILICRFRDYLEDLKPKLLIRMTLALVAKKVQVNIRIITVYISILQRNNKVKT